MNLVEETWIYNGKRYFRRKKQKKNGRNSRKNKRMEEIESFSKKMSTERNIRAYF